MFHENDKNIKLRIYVFNACFFCTDSQVIKHSLTTASLDLFLKDIYTLEVNTSQMYEDMIKEFLEDNSNASLGDLLEDLTVLITTSSQRKGTLTICVLHDSLDCSFQATT